ncbi:hypothetical protein [Streptomyces sp. NPDC050388]|uniref:hypothetical protein n=1 Tax=Streptomyces sp. NPDC050388 TaxID=3155781 RepID=UPI00342E1AC2
MHTEHERVLQALRGHSAEVAPAEMRAHLQRGLEQRLHTLVDGDGGGDAGR